METKKLQKKISDAVWDIIKDEADDNGFVLEVLLRYKDDKGLVQEFEFEEGSLD